MWWGGGSDEGGANASTTAQPTEAVDVLEILSEEDTDAGMRTPTPEAQEAPEAQTTPPRPSPQQASTPLSVDEVELRDLREQFQAQEALLGQLKGVLRSNEEKLVNKEKEVQNYALRLSQVRLHNRAKDVEIERLHSEHETRSEILPSPSKAMAVPAAAGGAIGSGKVKLLKRQLEESRRKEEEEMQRIKDLESLVKDLQRDLTERDMVINQMKEDVFSIASFRESPPSSPFVMSGTGSPTDTSPRRSPPLGQSYDSVASFESYAARSFTAKDDKILQLQEKNIELERTVMDLEENLRAKEELVRVRTEAVTLMSADLSAKGKSTLEQLEDTRIEMKLMQKTFADQEMTWKESNEMLKIDLESKAQQISNLEDDKGRLEKIRFDLTTKNAALQEKIVTLQTELKDIKTVRVVALEEDLKREQLKAETLEAELAKAHKSQEERNVALVAELRDIAGGDGDFGAKVMQLQNQLTELEDEKGQLQLKVIDLEETSGMVKQTELIELQEKFKSQSDLLDEHISTLSAVEREKFDLLEVVSARDDELSSKSKQVSELLQELEELKRSRVSLEMRAVDLEEQRDHWVIEKGEMEEKIQRFMHHLKTVEDPVDELKTQLSSVQSDYEALKEIHANVSEMVKLNEREMTEQADQIERNSVQIAELEKLLLSKNVEIAEGIARMTDLSKSNEELTSQIEGLRGEMSAVQSEKTELKAEVDKLCSEGALKDYEEQIASLRQHIEEKNTEAEETQARAADLDQKLYEAEDHISHLKESLSTIKSNLEQSETELRARDEELQASRSQLEDVQKALAQSEASKHEMETQMSETSEKALSELWEKNSKLTKDLAQREDTVAIHLERIAELESTVSRRDDDLQETKALVQTLTTEKEGIVSEIQELTKTLDQIRSEQEILQQTVSSLETEKVALVEKHETEIMEKYQQIEQSSVQLSEMDALLLEKDKEIGELNEKLAAIQADEDVAAPESSSNEKVRSLEQANKQLLEDLKIQEQELSSRDNRISDLVESLDRNKVQVEDLNSRLAAMSEELSNTRKELTELEREKAQMVSQPTKDTKSESVKEAEWAGFGDSEEQSEKAEEAGAAWDDWGDDADWNKEEASKPDEDDWGWGDNEPESEQTEKPEPAQSDPKSVEGDPVEIEAKYTKAIQALAEKEAQLSEHRSATAQLEEKLTSELEKTTVELQRLQSELGALSEERDRAMKQLADDKQHALNSEEQIADSKKQIAELSEELAAMTELKEKLVLQVSELEEAESRRSEAPKEGQTEPQHGEDIAELKKLNKQLAEEVSAKEEELEDRLIATGQLEEKLVHNLANLESLRQECHGYRTQIETLEAGMKTASEDRDKALGELEALKSESTVETDSKLALESKLKESVAHVDRLQTENQKTGKELTKAKKSLEKKVAEIKASKESLSQLKKEKERLKQDVEEYREDVSAKEGEISELQTRVLALNTEIESLKSNVAASDAPENTATEQAEKEEEGWGTWGEAGQADPAEEEFAGFGEDDAGEDDEAGWDDWGEEWEPQKKEEPKDSGWGDWGTSWDDDSPEEKPKPKKKPSAALKSKEEKKKKQSEKKATASAKPSDDSASAQTVANLNRDLQAKASVISELEKKVAQALKDAAEARNALKQQLLEHERDVQDRHEEVDTLKAKYEALKSELERAKDSAEENEQKCLELDEVRQNLEALQAQKNQHAEKYADELYEKTKLIAKLEEMVQSKLSELEAFSKQLTEKDVAFNNLLEHSNKLQEQIDARSSGNDETVEAIHLQIKALTEENVSMKEKYESELSEKKMLSQTLKDKELEIADQLATSERTITQQEQLNKSLADYQNKLAESEAEKDIVEEALDQAQTAKKDLANELQQRDELILRHEHEMNDIRTQMEAANATVANLEEVITALRKDLEDSRETEKRLQEEQAAAKASQPHSLGSIPAERADNEADIEDGWGDDSWGGAWGSEGEQQIGEHLRLSTSEDEMVKLKSELADTVSKLAEARLELQAAQERQSQDNVTLMKAQSDLEHQTEVNLVSEQTITALQQQVSEQDMTVQQWQQSVSERERTIEELRAGCDDSSALTEKLSALQKELELEASKRQENETALQEATSARIVAEDTASKLETQLQSEHEKIEEQVKMNSVSEQTIANLQQQVSEQNTTMQQWQQSLSEREQTIEELRARCEDSSALTEKLSALQKELELEASKRQENETALQEATSAKNVAEDTASKLEAQLQTEHDKTTKAQADVEEQVKLNSVSAQTIASLQQQVFERDEIIQQWQQFMAEKEKTIEQLQLTTQGSDSAITERVSELQSQIEAEVTRRQEIELALQEMREAKSVAEESIEKLKVELVEKEEQGAQQLQEFDQLQLAKVQLEETVTKMENAASEKDTSLEEVRMQLEASAHDTVVQYQELLSARDDLISTQQQQLDSLKQEILEANSKCDAVSQGRKEEEQALSAERAQTEERLEQLQEQLAANRTHIEDLERQLGESRQQQEQQQQIMLEEAPNPANVPHPEAVLEGAVLQQQPLDLDLSNRPLPDVTTQHHGPDVAAAFFNPPHGAQQPDLMPTGQAPSSIDLVQSQSVDAESWFNQAAAAADTQHRNPSPLGEYFQSPEDGEASAIGNYFGAAEPQAAEDAQHHLQPPAENVVFEQNLAQPQAHEHIQQLTNQQVEEEQLQASASIEPVAQAPGAPLTEEAAPSDYAQVVANYQQELSTYQQVIADWQAWAETQGSERAALEGSLAQFTEAYNTAAAELERLKTELDKAPSADSATPFEAEEVEKVKSRLRAKEMEVAELNETVDRLQCEKSDLAAEVQDLRQNNQTLKEESEALNTMEDKVDFAVYEDIKHALDDVTDEKEQVLKDLAEAKDHLQEAQRQNAELSHANSVLTDTLQTTSGDLQQARQDSEALEAQITESAARVAQLESEKSSLEVQIVDLNAAISELEEKVQSNADSAELQCQLEDARTRESELQQEKSTLQEDKAACEEELRQLNAEMETLKTATSAEVDRLKQELEASESKPSCDSDLSEQLAQYQAALGEWQGWAESQNVEFAKMQEMLQVYTAANEKANEDVNELTESLKEKEAEVAEFKATLAKLQGEKSGADERLSSMQQELETIKAAKDEAGQVQQDAVDRLQHQTESDAEEIRSLKTEINEGLQERSAIELRVRQVVQELQQAQGTIETLRGQLEERQSSEQSEKDGLSSELERLNVRLNINRNKNSDLEKQLSEANAALAALSQEKSQLADTVLELQEAQEAVAGERELWQNVHIENSKLREEVESLKLKLDSEQSEKQAMAPSADQSQDYAQFQQLNENLQLEIQQLRTYIAQQQAAYESLQQMAATAASPGSSNVAFERQLIRQLEADLQAKDQAMHALENELEHLKSPQTSLLSPQPERPPSVASTTSHEVSRLFEPDTKLTSENNRLKQDLEKSVRENRHLTNQMESWKQQLADLSRTDEEFLDDDDGNESTEVLKTKQVQAWRSVSALQLRVEELTLEVTKLLEERDTLQLKLSNVMRQYERQKESSSRASTACSTPIPWFDNTTEIKELRLKIEELSKLNYTKDVELQKQKQQMEAMQVKIRHHSSASPARHLIATPTPRRSESSRKSSQSGDGRISGPVLHL